MSIVETRHHETAHELAKAMLASPDAQSMRRGSAAPHQDALVRSILAGEILFAPLSIPVPCMDPPAVTNLKDIPPTVPLDGPIVAQLDWVEVQLVDQANQPVPHLPFRITLPNAEQRDGRLDGNGSLRCDPITSGDCFLELIDETRDGAAVLPALAPQAEPEIFEHADDDDMLADDDPAPPKVEAQGEELTDEPEGAFDDDGPFDDEED